MHLVLPKTNKLIPLVQTIEHCFESHGIRFDRTHTELDVEKRIFYFIRLATSRNQMTECTLKLEFQFSEQTPKICVWLLTSGDVGYPGLTITVGKDEEFSWEETWLVPGSRMPTDLYEGLRILGEMAKVFNS